MRAANRMYLAESRALREQRELAEITRCSKRFHQHKQHLSQNLMNGREYIRPDGADAAREIWNIGRIESMHDRIADDVQPAFEETDFEMRRNIYTSEGDEKDSLNRMSTALEG